MYLTHHYLIDVVAGACLAVVFFFLTMPQSVKGSGALERSPAFTAARSMMGMSNPRAAKYDLERRLNQNARSGLDVDSSSSRSSMDAPALPLGSVRSPNLKDGGGAAGFKAQQAKYHKHTASIASLIHANDRVEEGWSPVVADFAGAERARSQPSR